MPHLVDALRPDRREHGDVRADLPDANPVCRGEPRNTVAEAARDAGRLKPSVCRQ